MTETSLDRLTIAMSYGIRRRDAIRYCLSSFLLGTAAVSGRPSAAQSGAPEGQRASVALVAGVVKLEFEGNTSVLTIRDRGTGKIAINGRQEVSLAVALQESANRAELSVYDAARLIERKEFVIGGVGGTFKSGPLAGVTLSVTKLRRTQVPTDYLSADDCCVQCCWGLGCGNAVCCDPSTTACGGCCDFGFCPPCDI